MTMPELSVSPVFVVGLTWRTGSTLLQRMLNASNQILMWGEPWPSTHILQNLYLAKESFPANPGSQLADGEEGIKLANRGIALLSPSSSDFEVAVRGFYLDFFGAEAKKRGIHRWGFKDVHLDGANLEWLLQLFPNSKFLVIHRHPLDSWLSYINAHRGYAVGWRQPGFERPIINSREYSSHWSSRALSLYNFASKNSKNVNLISFETLTKDPSKLVQSIYNFCDLNEVSLDQSLKVSSKVLMTTSQKSCSFPLQDYDVSNIRQGCSEAAVHFGYDLNQ